MLLCHPEKILWQEPLQWGIDFCQSILEFLSEEDTPPSYKVRYCQGLHYEALLSFNSLQKERQAIEGNTVFLTRTHTAMRLFALHFLSNSLLCKNQNYPDELAIKNLFKKFSYLQNFLIEMEVNIEKTSFSIESYLHVFYCLKRKGFKSGILKIHGTVPLTIYTLPYENKTAPACYLRDLHAVLLFEASLKLEDMPLVLLHEIGHALFANMLRDLEEKSTEERFKEQILSLLAIKTTKRTKVSKHFTSRLNVMSENFCHHFVKVAQEKETPPWQESEPSALNKAIKNYYF